MRRRFLSFAGLLGGLLVVAPQVPRAEDQGDFGAVIRIEIDAFAPDAGKITFSEFPVGTANPVYGPETYGGGAGAVTVRFGGWFLGQRLAPAGQCPPGASRNGCLAGRPAAPLALDDRSEKTYIDVDDANPKSPSLSGTPQFDGPVTMLFDRDVAGVGLAGGFFDAVGSTAIQAYDRQGRLIGGVKNIGEGMEYMALVTEDGRDRIAGLQFSLIGAEPNGYAIDELSFALAGQVRRDKVPGIKDVLGKADDKDGDAARKAAEPAKADCTLTEIFERTGPCAGLPADGEPAPPRAKKPSLKDLVKP